MLKQRIISGCIIGSIFLAALFLPPYVGLLVMVFISTLGQLEFYRMLNSAGIPAFRGLGTIGGAALIATTFFTQIHVPHAHTQYDTLVLAGLLLIIFIRQFPQKHNDQPLATMGCTILGLLYVPFLFNFITRLALEWNSSPLVPYMSDTGGWLILYLILVVKSTDTGAFFSGRHFGRHKLFPRISPAKTWEGLVGGVVVAVASSVAFLHFTHGHLGALRVHHSDAVWIGIALSMAGIVGDMFESLIKRASGMKDSGAMMPGLGGILDVIDSLLFGGPILYAYITLVLS